MNKISILEKWREWSKGIKRKIYALYLAYRDPRVPWYAKLFGAIVAAYALSPVDLIPDFIPILGYLDDMILLPLGIALAIRMIPKAVMEDCYERAASVMSGRKKNWIAGGIIIAVWISVFLSILMIIMRRVRG